MSLVDGGKNRVGDARRRISAAVASAELNILRTSITNYLHKRSNTAGGYHWEFFKEEN